MSGITCNQSSKKRVLQPFYWGRASRFAASLWRFLLEIEVTSGRRNICLGTNYGSQTRDECERGHASNTGKRMTAHFNLNWRYGAYGAVTVLVAIIYLCLGDASDPQPEAGGRPSAANELPGLRFLDDVAQVESHRDLFSFVRPAHTPEPAQPASVIALMPPPRIQTAQEPDPLSNLKVLGLVRRSSEVTVLLQIGTTLNTVRLGERFGTGDALSVRAIQGRNVTIEDSNARTSKTYALSEE